MKKKSKKLTLDKTTVRQLTGDLRDVSGGMSANVRCSQSTCHTDECSLQYCG